jgi:hypothetical protein
LISQGQKDTLISIWQGGYLRNKEAGLVIAQFVPGTDSFQWLFFLAGLLGIVMAYIAGILLMKSKGGD